MSSSKPDRQAIEDVANRLHSVAIHLLRRLRRVDRESGLTAERLSLLSVLVYGGECTISDLAEIEMVSLPAVTRSVTALEGAGLVNRSRDLHDRRRVRVATTAEGRRLMEDARQRRLQALIHDLGEMREPDIDTLASAVEILEAMLGQSAPPPPTEIRQRPPDPRNSLS